MPCLAIGVFQTIILPLFYTPTQRWLRKVSMSNCPNTAEAGMSHSLLKPKVVSRISSHRNNVTLEA